jgi:murein DD-endopeptidase MepM/ murein hydrolase activator NlpD
VEVAVDPEALGLSSGDAFLAVVARDWSWRGALGGNATTLHIPVSVDLKPPRIAVRSGLTYVRRGGAAAVAYRLSEEVGRNGVEVGARFYPGVDWPAGCPSGTSGCRLAVFAVAVDAPPEAPVRVVAEDRAGNLAVARWATRLQERPNPQTSVALSQPFLESKVRDLANAWGIDAADPVAAFREINTRVRERDEARIRELAGGAPTQPRWQGAFGQLANSKVTSLFAERRIYRVGDEAVSSATHYGYDLASTAGAPVTASNAGRVLFAGELGIYGDCVLVDHGLGIVSLYGHLSSMDVNPGDDIAKGQILGRTGQTGLAGGDHLHFAILVGGTYVDPREWWDPKWVREHVEVRMAR